MASCRYIAGLDGLRAIAALAVFGVHLQQMTGLKGSFGPFDVERLLANGNTGVCLFFMLSGFLLSLPFYGSQAVLQHGSSGMGWSIGYAIRRIGRIVPVYYLALTALIVMGK